MVRIPNGDLLDNVQSHLRSQGHELSASRAVDFALKITRQFQDGSFTREFVERNKADTLELIADYMRRLLEFLAVQGTVEIHDDKVDVTIPERGEMSFHYAELRGVTVTFGGQPANA